MSRNVIKSIKFLFTLLFAGSIVLNVACSQTEITNINTEHDAIVSEYADNGYEHIITDGSLSLYLNKSNGQFYVKDNDSIFYSNPVDSENDSIANNFYKMNMKSQIEIRYLNSKLKD